MALPKRDEWTYKDYAALPDDDKRYEVLQGRLVLLPTPNTAHQTALGALFYLVMGYVLKHKPGWVYPAPFDVVLDRHNVVQPDITYISNARLSILTKANVKGSPDLAVEVILPPTRRRDRTQKFRIYAAHGIAHYWIVDPIRRTLEAYEVRAGGYVLADKRAGDAVFQPALFPGLDIPLAMLWS